MPTIVEAYRKDVRWPPGFGYGRRVAGGLWVAGRGATLSAEIVHSTNNSKPTAITGEAGFLRDSPDVSCHDLIAKNGDVYIILPDSMLGWHAGLVKTGFSNELSCGTELHVSVGEKPTAAQLDSLAYRIRQRRATYNIIKERIDTHRAVALPLGRKSDPEGFPDAQFYAWRDSLFVSTEPDWPVLWGTAWPYFSESGIAQTWRDQYRLGKPLGKAISDELQAVGVVLRCFDRGYITWNAATGTKVKEWNA